MANCTNCSTQLKFMNTPTFGSGKLSDGNVLCMDCFKKVNKINPGIGFKLKNYSTAQITELFETNNVANAQVNLRLDEIKLQISNLNLSGGASFLGRREINELPSILSEKEQIDNLAQGTFNNGQGILVSTDRRLLFIDKGMLYGLKVEDFPLDKISSIQYETGLLLGSIKIFTTSNVAKIDNVEKVSARNFAEFVRNKLSAPKQETTTNLNSEPSVLDQIEKLAKLKENGILTDDEFAEQKKKLLEKL